MSTLERIIAFVRYLFVCVLGLRCKREFEPMNPCVNCGRRLHETLAGRRSRVKPLPPPWRDLDRRAR